MGSKTEQTGSAKGRGSVHIGLEVKAAVILAVVVTAVLAAGSWSYYNTTHKMLRQRDLEYAGNLAKALGAASEDGLRRDDIESLRTLAREAVREDGVLYAAVADERGDVVVQEGLTDEWLSHARLPVETRLCGYRGPGRVFVARPILARNGVWLKDRFVGSLRIVVDTAPTVQALAEAKRRIVLTAVGIELLAIPLGCLMVWRVMVGPIRKLLRATRRLTAGDFQARCDLKRNDETGQLAGAFNEMAEHIGSIRAKLLAHRDELEHQVDQQTRELREANERLRDEIQDKEEFLRAVSHDLNAPMRNIAGMATMILLNCRDQLPEEAVARLQRIQANADQQAELISELLEISRIKSRPEARDEVNIGELLRSLMETFEYELSQRGIELVVCNTMPTLWVEKNRIRQIFQNLIDNAIKYMHRQAGGRIHVRYRFNGRQHEFQVQDNGPGIPADQREKVFVVFRRGSQAGRVKGKGVGLTVVRTIVSNYGGRVWLRSVEDKGSIFTFTLADSYTQAPKEVAASGL